METETLIETFKKIENMFIDQATGSSAEQEEYSRCRDIVLKEYYSTQDILFKNKFPSLIIEYDTVNSFWQFIKYKFAHYRERRSFIYDTFKPIRQYFESKKYTNNSKLIFPKIVISNEHIQAAIDKANQRIKDKDFDGAITTARTLVEEIQTEIYRKLKKTEPNHKGDLSKLYGMVAPLLNLSISKTLDNRLKEILSGLYSINNGIANLRNVSGDAHAKKFTTEAHHAQLAVNCAFTFSQFLCDTYLYQTQK